MKRRLLIIAAAAIAVLVALVIGGLFYLDSNAGRAWLAAVIEDAVSEPGVMELRLGAIGPGLPGRISIESASLADSEGVWLELEDLTLDWDPWSLLSRHLDVENAEVASVTVVREPVPDPAAEPPVTAEAEPFAMPELPVDVTIDKLAVTRLALDAALFGTAALLDIDAELSATRGGDVRLVLAVERLDGVGGSLHAEADINLDESRLSLSAEAYEPPDGVLVHLLDLAPYPEFSLRLTGEGPATAWSGNLSTSAGDLAAIDLALDVGAGETLEIAVDGTAAVAALLPEDLRDVAGPKIGLTAGLSVDGGLVRVKHLDVTARALSLAAEGVIQTDASSVDMKVAATGLDPAPLEVLAAPLEVGAWRVNLSAIGDIDTPQLTVDANAEAVKMEDLFSGDIALTAQISPGSSDGWHAQGQVTASGASTGIDAAQGLLGSDPRIDFVLDTDAAFAQLSDLSLSVTGTNVTLAAEGDVDLEEFSGQVNLDATIGDVAAFSDMIGLPIGGGLGLQSNLVLDPDVARATGRLSLTGDGFGVDDETISPFIGREFVLTSDIESDLATSLSLIDLAVKTEAVDLAGTLNLTDDFARLAGRLDGPLQMTPALADLAGLDPGGSAGLSLRFAGAVEDPVIRLRAKLNGVAIAGTSLDGVTLDAEARDLADTPRGEGLVSVPSPAGVIKVATSFAVEGDDVALPVMAIEGAGVDGAGWMRLDGAGIVTGELRGTVVDIAPLAAIGGVDASGAAVFLVELAPDETGGQGADVSLQATDATMFAGEDDAVSVGELRLAARISDLAGEPTGSADLSVGAALYQSYRLDGAVIHADMDGGVVAVDLKAQGDAGVPLTVDVGVDLDLASEALTLAFKRLEGTVSGEAFAQQGDLRIVLGDEALTVDDLALSFAGGTISGDAVRAPDAVDANIIVADLPLDVVEIFVPGSALTGVINGQVDLATSRGAIVGTVNFSASDIDLSEGIGDEGVPADIELTATLGEANARADIVVGGLPGSEIEGSIDIGAAIDAETLEVRNAQVAPLDASLNLRARLETIWDDLPASDQRMRGDLNVQLTATGVVGDPQVTGEASLSGGSYEHLVYGTLIEDIQLSMTGDSTRNLVVRLSANDGGTGTITAGGDISLGEDNQIEAQLSFQDATLVRRDDVTASASGDLSYSGSPLSGAIAGTITTNQVDISLVNTLPSSVVVLDVQDVFDGQGNGGPSGGGALWSATLDVDIEMPRRVFVRGRGVDTEWFGHVDITGTTNDPVIDGKLEIQRGQVSLVGRVFEMTRGSVVLDPEEPDDPIIDIVAETKRQDVTGIITISGRASDPSIEITSNPSLPQAEVLPRVLFGKSASNLSAFEAFELASAVAELSGVGGGGPGIMDRARQTLGVDVLRLGSDDEGATTVGAGSYVTERVYVGVEQGTGSQSGSVKVEVEVTDDITVDTSTGSDASANVGVNWRWDY